jgi:hypothetical protein
VIQRLASSRNAVARSSDRISTRVDRSRSRPTASLLWSRRDVGSRESSRSMSRPRLIASPHEESKRRGDLRVLVDLSFQSKSPSNPWGPVEGLQPP